MNQAVSIQGEAPAAGAKPATGAAGHSSLSANPLLQRLQSQLSEDRSAETFADSLELLIDRLETLGKK